MNPRKVAWAGAALLAAATIAATVWGVQAWQTNRTMANVESSLAGRSQTAGPATASTAPGQAPLAQQAAQVDQLDQMSRDNQADRFEPGQRMAPVAAAPASADRLPPLVLPGQPVPAAVLRDLPEWVTAQVAPAQTSGGSGDESAAPAVVQSSQSSQSSEPSQPPVLPQRQRQRGEAAPRKDRYGAVFARCPGPGESGAVECRRAVCDGAAKKTAACVPYLK